MRTESKGSQPSPLDRDLSSGEATNRRRVLAQERREIPQDPLDRVIRTRQEAEERLCYITKTLDQENNLTPQGRASFKIETIWLEFKLGRTTSAERQSAWQRFLNQLKKEDSDVYTWLLEEEEKKGTSPLAIIRDRIFPPEKIGGYYSKRDR